MSDITRKSLPPIGMKPVTMSGRDAQEHAKELIRIALYGQATYHPDGSGISDKHRLERLRQVPRMLEKLCERVTNVLYHQH
jgi:hypothetical protein